jgi:Ca-activated chloride channel family protein
LNAAHPDQAGTQGTAIGKAVRLAAKPKEEGRSEGQGAIVILTDGEDHDTDAPLAIAEAVDAGWMTFVIGVGTESGGTIPISIEGRKDVKRDDQGQPVQTIMNRPLMMELSQKGNGKYFDINDGPAVIADLKKEFAGLERSQLEKRSFSEHKSYFQWFLLPALIILMLMPMINLKHDVI